MSNRKPNFTDCCREVAEKYGVGTTLVTGHRASYFAQAAQLYADRCVEEATRWIPVSERTPEKGQQVYVIGYREAELYPAAKEPSVGIVYWNMTQSSKCSDTCFYSFGYTNITHWMPIPELHKHTQP
jgi:hypothetical protein